MIKRAHTCQSERMQGDARQNEGIRIKDLFPAQNHSVKSLVVSERPNHERHRMSRQNPLKLHYANKFHEPPGVEAIHNVKL